MPITFFLTCKDKEEIEENNNKHSVLIDDDENDEEEEDEMKENKSMLKRVTDEVNKNNKNQEK